MSRETLAAHTLFAMSSSKPSNTSKILANVGFETVHFDYEVSFERFTILTEHCVVTKEFSPPGRHDPTLELRLYPNIDSYPVIETQVSLYVKKSNSRFIYSISSWLLKKNGEIYMNQEYKFEYKRNFEESKNYSIYSEKRDNVVKEKNGLLPEDILTFCCEVTLELPTVSQKVTIARPVHKVDNKLQIAENLEKLLKSGTYSDFEFTVGQHRFPVHKAILHSQSAYFAAMLSGDYKEKTVGSVSIEDIDASLFAELLLYLYTGQVPAMAEVNRAIELLIISDRYQLDSLKAICEDELSEKMLTAESMFTVLLAAETYNASGLKEKAMEFIASRATTKDVLKGLFDLFIGENGGKAEPKSMTTVIQDLMKMVKD